MRAWLNEMPLGTTRWLSLLNLYRSPMGSNVMVAISTLDGTNQEDGICVNRASLDVGLFRSFLDRTVTAREKRQLHRTPAMMHKQEILEEQCDMLSFRYGSETKGSGGGRIKVTCTYEKTPYILPTLNPSEAKEEFGCVPQEECLNGKKEDFSKIGIDGIIEIGCRTFSGTIVVAKTQPLPNGKYIDYPRHGKTIVIKRRDTSIPQKKSDYGRVLQVFLSNDSQGDRITRIKITKVAVPTPGDKLTSRHGQKGVLSRVFDPEDLPFTNDGMGVIPELIINPIGYYARSTKGQDFESMVATICALVGIQEIDCTSNSNHLFIIQQGLREVGDKLQELKEAEDEEGVVETIKNVLGDIFHHLETHTTWSSIHDIRPYR